MLVEKNGVVSPSHQKSGSPSDKDAPEGTFHTRKLSSTAGSDSYLSKTSQDSGSDNASPKHIKSRRSSQSNSDSDTVVKEKTPPTAPAEAETDPTLIHEYSEKLLRSLFFFLSMKRSAATNFPMIAGAPGLHIAMRNAASIAAFEQGVTLSPDTHVEPEELIGFNEVHLIPGSEAQFNDWSGFLGRFLTGTTAVCSPYMDQTGSMVYAYTINDKPFFTIILATPTASNYPLPCHTISTTSLAEQPATVNCTAHTGLQLRRLYEKLQQPQTIESLTEISFEFDQIKAYSIFQEDYFLFAAVTALYDHHYYTLFPNNLNQTQEFFEQQQQELAVSSKIIKQPSKPSSSGMGKMIESPLFCDSLFQLNRGKPDTANFSYDLVAKWFETAKRTAPPSSAHGKRAKKMNKKDKIPGGYLSSELEKEAMEGLRALSTAIGATSTRSQIEAAFNSGIADQMTEFVKLEEAAALTRGELHSTPYLGKVLCPHAVLKQHPLPKVKRGKQKRSTGAEPTNRCELQTKCFELASDTLVYLKKAISTEPGRHEKEFALVSSLMLKLSVYKTEETEKNYYQCLLALVMRASQVSLVACNPSLNSGSNNKPWRILPQTLLCLLASETTDIKKLNQSAQQELLICLGAIMKAAQIQGDFDISAACISLLARMSPDLKTYSEAPVYNELRAQISQFFSILANVTDSAQPGTHLQVCTARTLYDLSSELIASKQRLTGLLMDVSELDQYCEKGKTVLKRQEDEIHALDKAIKKSIETEEKKKQDAREKLEKARLDAQVKLWKEKLAKEKEEERGKSPTHGTTPFVIETSPLTQTAEKHLSRRKTKWQTHLGRAVVSFQLSQTATAKESMRQALAACGDSNINKACVHTDCGEAQLQPKKPLIHKLCVLGNDCATEFAKMKELLGRATNELQGACSHDRAKEWLKENPITTLDRFNALIQKFPCEEDIHEAVTAIQSAIEHHSKAIELLKQCNPEEISDQGQFVMNIIEADLKKLHASAKRIELAKANLSDAMKLRKTILDQLGLYGKKKDQKETVHYKHWFTEARDEFQASKAELASLFRTQDTGEKLDRLFTDIELLRQSCHPQGAVKGSPVPGRSVPEL